MKYDIRLIVVLGATFGVLFLDRNAVNYLMPFIAADLHFSNQQVGLVASALSFSWAISSFLGGVFSDRTGYRKAVLVSSVIMFSLCSFLSGLVGTFMGLFFARLLMGLAEGPYLPVAQSLVALESPAQRRGNNMGVMQNLGSNLVGMCLGPIVLIPIAHHYDWRIAFYVAGVPGLIMALLIAKYVREPAVPKGTQAAAGPGSDMRIGQMLKFRNMWLCMLISIVMVAWMVLGWAFLPLFYVRDLHLTDGEMTAMMSVLGVSAAFFSLIVPRLSDRFGRRPIVILFSLVGLLVPLAALYLHESLYALGALIFLGWSASGTFPLFMGTIPSETIPARYVATTLGLTVGLGEILGGVLGPAIAGRAADLHGLQAALLIEAGCALVGTALACFLIETAPSQRRAGAPIEAAT